MSIKKVIIMALQHSSSADAYAALLGIGKASDAVRVSSAEEVLTLLAESTHAKTASASASPFSRAYGVRVVLAWSAKFVAAEKMAAAREHLLPRAWRALDGALAQSATLTTPETVPNGIGLKVLRAMRTIAASPTSRLTAYDGALTRVLASLLASYEADDAAAVGVVVHLRPPADAYAKFVAALAAAPGLFVDDVCEVEAHAAFLTCALRITNAMFKRSGSPRRMFEIAVDTLVEPLLRLRAHFERSSEQTAVAIALVARIDELLRATLFASALLPTYRDACAAVRAMKGPGGSTAAGGSEAEAAKPRPKKKRRKSRAGCDIHGVPLSFQRALFEKIAVLARQSGPTAQTGDSDSDSTWAVSAAVPLLFDYFLVAQREEAAKSRKFASRKRAGGGGAAAAAAGGAAGAVTMAGGVAPFQRAGAAAALTDEFCVLVELLAITRGNEANGGREAAAAMVNAVRTHGVYRPEIDDSRVQFGVLMRLAEDFVAACEQDQRSSIAAALAGLCR